jgi:hypothetical protein
MPRPQPSTSLITKVRSQPLSGIRITGQEEERQDTRDELKAQACSTRADFTVGGVVFLFPGWQFRLAACVAVRDDQTCAPAATVSDHRRLVYGTFGVGRLPRLVVVAVACAGSASRITW